MSYTQIKEAFTSVLPKCLKQNDCSIPRYRIVLQCECTDTLNSRTKPLKCHLFLDGRPYVGRPLRAQIPPQPESTGRFPPGMETSTSAAPRFVVFLLRRLPLAGSLRFRRRLPGCLRTLVLGISSRQLSLGPRWSSPPSAAPATGVSPIMNCLFVRLSTRSILPFPFITSSAPY